MPFSHVSKVIKAQAVLLYALVTGKSIDIRKVIYDSIRHTQQGSSTSGLPHSSLICGLCKNVNVVYGKDEIFERLNALIDSKTISRFKEWQGGIPHLRMSIF